MIYFFLKEQQVLQWEIYPGRPHVLTGIEPGGMKHTERYHSSDHLHERWEQVCEQLAEEGWNGPFGRDSRV